MIHPRPYSRGFLFTETKAIELFRGQTLQRGLKYTPLRKFVLYYLAMVGLLLHESVHIRDNRTAFSNIDFIFLDFQSHFLYLVKIILMIV